MHESGNYPPGAEFDPSAPWNEPVVPERDFNVVVSQTLSRDTILTTQEYNPVYDDETGHTDADTLDTDWVKIYKEDQYTPLEIIDIAGKMATFLEEQGYKKFQNINLRYFIENCHGWIEDETEVTEE